MSDSKPSAIEKAEELVDDLFSDPSWDELFKREVRDAFTRALDAFAAERVNEERARIAERVSERRILRLSVGVDPLEEANSIIQDLAHDIETNWSDYEDEE